MKTTRQSARKAGRLDKELEEMFAKARPSSETRAELEKGCPDFDSDPEFVAGYMRAQFVEDVYRAMSEAGLSKNTLAQRLGKTRQYVGRILNETANFTFRTVAEVACSLGWQIDVRMFSPDEHLVVVANVMRRMRVFPSFDEMHKTDQPLGIPGRDYKEEPQTTSYMPGGGWNDETTASRVCPDEPERQVA